MKAFKTTRLSVQSFPCVAEAVAHFFKQGFATFDDSGEVRFMRKEAAGGFEEVRIQHTGLLAAEASRVFVPT